MPRGRVRIQMPPKPCERGGCDVMFERREQQTTKEFRRQRFCSVACARGRAREDMGDLCGKGLHTMTPDNSREGSDGRVRCKECARIRDAKRSTNPAGPRPKAAVPVAPVAAALPGPRWRPAGWPDQPRTTTFSAQAS